MIVKYAVSGLLGTALLTGIAFAQAPAPRPDSKVSSPSTSSQSHQGMWRASKLVGVNVYNDNNESLGNINDLIVDTNGAVKNVVIGVGGFLGVGERYISVGFDKLKWSNDPVRMAGSSSPPAGGMDSGKTVGSSPTTPSAPTSPPAPSSSTSRTDSWYPDHAILSASKDEIKSMPEFKY